MNEIMTTPVMSQGDVQFLKSKKLFIKEMSKAINDESISDTFFNRPDCIAEIIWNLHSNTFSLMDDPLINGMLNYLIRAIAFEDCNFDWCIKNGSSTVDHDEFEKYRIKLGISLESLEEHKNLSIKYLASRLLKHGLKNGFGWHDCYSFDKNVEAEIKYFLFRLMIVQPDTYWKEGWM